VDAWQDALRVDEDDKTKQEDKGGLRLVGWLVGWVSGCAHEQPWDESSRQDPLSDSPRAAVAVSPGARQGEWRRARRQRRPRRRRPPGGSKGGRPGLRARGTWCPTRPNPTQRSLPQPCPPTPPPPTLQAPKPPWVRKPAQQLVLSYVLRHANEEWLREWQPRVDAACVCATHWVQASRGALAQLLELTAEVWRHRQAEPAHQLATKAMRVVHEVAALHDTRLVQQPLDPVLQVRKGGGWPGRRVGRQVGMHAPIHPFTHPSPVP
jgi:hypothetical protein